MAKRTKKRTTKKRRQKPAGNAKAPLGPGPGKRALRGKLGHVSRNHKRRSVWFQARAAWPLREACVSRLVSERARAEKEFVPASGTTQWESVGPTNIGGRITCLACDPAKPDNVWAGAAGGG